MPNLIQENEAAAITWDSAGTSALFTPTTLGAGAGRQGAHYDFGVAARTRRYVWRAWLKPGATRVVGERVEIYLKTSDGTHPDNDDGTGDIAVSSSDKLRNLWPIGVIQIDENAAVEMTKSGDIEISARYVAPVFWNATANALSTTATDYGFSLTPVPDEIQ
jgi:hypothetical protein